MWIWSQGCDDKNGAISALQLSCNKKRTRALLHSPVRLEKLGRPPIPQRNEQSRKNMMRFNCLPPPPSSTCCCAVAPLYKASYAASIQEAKLASARRQTEERHTDRRKHEIEEKRTKVTNCFPSPHTTPHQQLPKASLNLIS